MLVKLSVDILLIDRGFRVGCGDLNILDLTATTIDHDAPTTSVFGNAIASSAKVKDLHSLVMR